MAAPQREPEPAIAPATPAGPLADLVPGMLDCVHCGLCLPVCPTYRETGRESSSPRGRIYLLRAVAEGRLPLDAGVAEEAYLCLDCRACETACPSGVGFGRLIEATRAAVEQAGLRGGFASRIERFALRELVPKPRRLRALVDLLALVQWLRLDRLARPLLPRALRELSELAPQVPSRRSRRALPELVPAQGERRGRVGLFVGCVMPEFFGDVNAATARVLARNGFDVVVPAAQGCCGALHAHAGDPGLANDLARRNIDVFGAANVDAVVVNSAGCGAAMREAGYALPGFGEPLAAAVRDVCEFLDDAGLRPPTGRVEGRVCYDDPCHLVHAQGVRDAPRRLLAQIPGVTLVLHDDPTSCCGAAGIYNLTHREMSRAVLAHKLKALAAAEPDWIASGNPGCLMQLRSGAQASGLRARVVHPVELLDLAYSQPES
ncbi:MAG: glycolate oxidase [Deltaproteobacteria bacterium]|nr:glycolate oxidase [Deltaproteobacteria bacterium]